MDLVFEEPKPEPGLATEAGKAFVISGAAAVGSLAGMFAIAYVVGWISDRREKRKAKRDAPLTKDN